MRHALQYTATAAIAFCLGGIWNIRQSPGFQSFQQGVFHSCPGTTISSQGRVATGETAPKHASEQSSSGTLTISLLPADTTPVPDDDGGEPITPDPVHIRISQLSRSMIRHLASELEISEKEMIQRGIEAKIREIELVTNISPEQRVLLARYYYADKLRELVGSYISLSTDDVWPGTKPPNEILGETVNEAVDNVERQRWGDYNEYQHEQLAAFIEEQAGLSPAQREVLERILRDPTIDPESAGAYYRRELQLTDAQKTILSDATNKVNQTDLTTDLIQLYQPGIAEADIPPQFFFHYDDPEKRAFSYRRMRSHIIDRELSPHLSAKQRELLAAIRAREDAVDMDQYQD